MQKRNRQLKTFLFEKLYSHPRVVRMEVKARGVLSSLFQAYEKQPKILPTEVQANINERGLHRTICDYLAGMTDRFAIQEHARLFDPSSLP
jgi:dGTPase